MSGRNYRSYRRRGSMLMIVLGSSMLCMVIGLAALTTIRIERKAGQNEPDILDAQLYAESAIEMGFMVIRTESDWRTNRGESNWFNNDELGRGKYSLEVSFVPDGDGDLSNNDVIMTAEGKVGSATRTVRVQLAPTKDTYTVVPGSWEIVTK